MPDLDSDADHMQPSSYRGPTLYELISVAQCFQVVPSEPDYNEGAPSRVCRYLYRVINLPLV